MVLLGLGRETSGLALEAFGLGLGLGLETPGLVNIPGCLLHDVAGHTQINAR